MARSIGHETGMILPAYLQDTSCNSWVWFYSISYAGSWRLNKLLIRQKTSLVGKRERPEVLFWPKKKRHACNLSNGEAKLSSQEYIKGSKCMSNPQDTAGNSQGSMGVQPLQVVQAHLDRPLLLHRLHGRPALNEPLRRDSIHACINAVTLGS